jgi:hypothetical protein
VLNACQPPLTPVITSRRTKLLRDRSMVFDDKDTVYGRCCLCIVMAFSSTLKLSSVQYLSDNAMADIFGCAIRLKLY